LNLNFLFVFLKVTEVLRFLISWRFKAYLLFAVIILSGQRKRPENDNIPSHRRYGRASGAIQTLL
jgi:hypothetical protein